MFVGATQSWSKQPDFRMGSQCLCRTADTRFCILWSPIKGCEGPWLPNTTSGFHPQVWRRPIAQVLQEMSRHQATGLTETETGVDMQGITHLLADTGLVTRDNVEMSEVSTKCHKDIVDVHRLHKWSRGIQVIVGAGGIILDWAPLYRAENPLQVVFILFKYLLKRFCGVPESEFKDFFISYAPVLVLNQSHFFCNFSFWSSLQSKDFYLNWLLSEHFQIILFFVKHWKT